MQLLNSFFNWKRSQVIFHEHVSVMQGNSNDRVQKRRNTIEELLTFEKTYANLMSLMVHRFMEPLASKVNILSAEDYDKLFPYDVRRDILRQHLLLYQLLIDITNIIQPESKRNDNIGDICPHFVTFPIYPLYTFSL